MSHAVRRDASHVGARLGIVRVDGIEQRLERGGSEPLGSAGFPALAYEHYAQTWRRERERAAVAWSGNGQEGRRVRRVPEADYAARGAFSLP